MTTTYKNCVPKVRQKTFGVQFNYATASIGDRLFADSKIYFCRLLDIV